MRGIIRWLLIGVAMLCPKNWKGWRRGYPQLWYCWPRWTKRVRWVHAIKTRLCGWLTGHEWSKTEWGYAGRGQVDHWCRWCDKLERIPFAESPAPTKLLADLTDRMKDLEP